MSWKHDPSSGMCLPWNTFLNFPHICKYLHFRQFDPKKVHSKRVNVYKMECGKTQGRIAARCIGWIKPCSCFLFWSKIGSSVSKLTPPRLWYLEYPSVSLPPVGTLSIIVERSPPPNKGFCTRKENKVKQKKSLWQYNSERESQILQQVFNNKIWNSKVE